MLLGCIADPKLINIRTVLESFHLHVLSTAPTNSNKVLHEKGPVRRNRSVAESNDTWTLEPSLEKMALIGTGAGNIWSDFSTDTTDPPIY